MKYLQEEENIAIKYMPEAKIHVFMWKKKYKFNKQNKEKKNIQT